MTASPDVLDTIDATRLCGIVGCGVRFVPHRADHQWCSRKCQHKAFWLRKKLSLPDRPCEKCGRLFKPRRNAARFCSKRCKDRHNRRLNIMETHLDPDDFVALHAVAERLGLPVSRVAQMCVERVLGRVPLQEE